MRLALIRVFARLQREPFSETKKRLQARTGTSEKELAKTKFAIIQPTVFKQPAPIQAGPLAGL